MEIVEKKIKLGGIDQLAFLGFNDANLDVLENRFEASVAVRGDTAVIRGEPVEVGFIEKVIKEMVYLVQRNGTLLPKDVETIIDLVKGGRAEQQLQGQELDDVILIAKDNVIKARSEKQKEYYRKVRENDIVFSIGPAGTGKTYLAVAMAVAAFRNREVTKLVLARPAVEAGESLGFLPGDLKEKIDPYLRPLYDALDDMVPADKLKGMIEKRGIEVVPLAYMRGRAQPLGSPVLTPAGFRPIGSIRVGDEVIGSNGKPVRVLGVYQQGVKDVYRVTMTDGSSTLCCGEHLWTVQTRDDKRRGRGPRVLETSEMIGNLRCHHYHRYELPLLSSPVEFAHRDVPVEPYALGLLLGDGCLTGKTTPSFATIDCELADSLDDALVGVGVVHKVGPDYVLKRDGTVAGGRANPLTAQLRELGLCGTRSHTKFIPEEYLHNSAEVRLALLQGLLDTDGGPVLQEGRSCRVQYTTTSPALRDGVLFLVRSLGGVATVRTRVAEGRAPGFANGRPVGYRHDAYVLDIRLPAGVEPFRLKRKAERYYAAGGGRPMRYIDSIEPAGREECVCIRVEADDALYLTDDFIVTHNTLNNAFVILDEAQNSTAMQMKMFLTRLGANSRAIITGDLTQIDLPKNVESGLIQAERILQGIDGIGFVYFDKVDVVRHRLVKEIIKAYEDHGVVGGV